MPNRAAIVSTAIVILAAAGLLSLYQVVDAQARQGDPYQIDTQLSRLQQAVAALPPRAQAGYVSDMDLSTARGLLAFNAARYALAPRLLTRDAMAADTGWVLGNFSQAVDYAGFGAQRGLTLAQDFGNGVVLYRRAGK
ncbi:MAG TPA: hypothetical protein VGR73_02830 [Bryobacteraceae bacterium]|nr:hypothetical protein [Bryobacteraceae bacterium]